MLLISGAHKLEIAAPGENAQPALVISLVVSLSLPGGRIRQHCPQLVTFPSTDQRITLFCASFCLKAPYLIHAVNSVASDSRTARGHIGLRALPSWVSQSFSPWGHIALQQSTWGRFKQRMTQKKRENRALRPRRAHLFTVSGS